MFIQVADEQDMPDKRGACIVAGVTVDQEVGADPHNTGERQFWCPWNPADPESENYPHDSESNDGLSVGDFQQQKSTTGALWWGPTSSEMDLHSAATTFMQRLKAHGYDASTAQAANDSAQAIQGSGEPNAYGQWFGDINKLYDSVTSGSVVQGATITERPDFNEYALWSPNSQTRNGTKVDLWLIHTEEGNSNADGLARNVLDNPASQVSYHYTISQAADGGVTVCDVVDTDLASWSVLDANNRSIDGCFAGSTVNWSTQQWMDLAGKAIDVFAYIVVQDCIKYGIPFNVIAPDPTNNNLYHSDPPGISDHKYVTDYLNDGTHTDVGPNFPWPYFASRIQYWAGVLTGATSVSAPVPPAAPAAPVVVAPPVVAPPAVPEFVYPTQEQMIIQIWEQLFGYQGKGFPSLLGTAPNGARGLFTVEAIGAIKNKVAA